ncbi:hypothetical protein INT45_007754 [Circinella minor]|uniref:Exocyst complex component Sec10 n=1 Tax=Circinella minor TaxID=1195481 RepID=A0A8H7S1J4_9FUNG|nr:hypothetical protein INT45_007754 [Circinella minor]
MSTSSRPRGPRLFDLPHDVKKLLTIDTFKGNVSTDDFMEQISTNLVAQMKDHTGAAAFDPKPFIRTFENVLDELIQLRTRVQEQCDELENSTQIVEHQYKQDIADMHNSFKDVYRSYDNLESRIGDVGNTAIRIGEQLETIDKQRSRASESRDIIEYFMEFQEGNSERLSLLCEGGDEGQLKAAIICRRLNAVAKEVDTDVKARIGIEKFCESFEKEMLEDFDRAYTEGDPRVMAHRAKVLFEFNGGASCVQTYVNQHEFFISNKKIEEMEELRRSEDNLDLSNPNIPPPEVDTSLVKLYDDIRITVRKEANIISAVFPQPATVMQVFLQRVFAQSIQNHVELLLSRAERYSHLAYLRTLASTHAETKRLVDNLKFYCDKEAKLTDAADASGLLTSASPEEALDRCMNDLFVPYTEADRYLSREKLALNELFGRIIAEFLNYMQERKKNSARNQSVLTRTLNQISASTSGAMLYPGSEQHTLSPISTNPFDRGFDGASPTTENANLSNNNNRNGLMNDTGNLVTVDDDGFKLLSQNAIMRMLNIHAESIVRCMELSDTQNLPNSILFLYSVLLDFIGTKYLDIALDDVIEELGSKAEPDTSCFPVVSTTTKVLQLMQKHFQTAVLPLVVGSPSVHRNVLGSKNTFMAALESKANDVLRKELESITSWLKELLSLQKRNDFRPKDEDIIMMSMGTQKFYVTPTGGLLVTKDISKYEEVIQMFKIPALNDLYEMLRQLGNIFLVKPEILRSILSEGYLARLDPSMLYPYLEKRVDFKSAKLDRILGVVDENAATAPPADSKAQRRSLFVNENTVLKEMRKNYNRDFLNQEFIAAFKN